MGFDSDVIVVGSGAGGATFAYACARAGKRVLLLERGPRPRPEEHPLDERATLLEKRPYEDRPVEVNGTPRHLYVGGVLGGGTALYGAALLRPARQDFAPGKSYGDRLPRNLWDWPVGYDELEPHYDEAERLLGVAGESGEDFGPLEKPRAGYPGLPLPLHPSNARLMTANRAAGLRPFRLPLGIDSALCKRCSSCAGFVCPTGARRSAAHAVERGVGSGLPIDVVTHAEVQGFSRDGAGRIDGVRAVDRVTGKQAVYRARRYALAAGAINSAVLLLRSGLGGPLAGRHYMAHLSPIVVGVFRRATGCDSFVKQVGFADYYLGAENYPHKLGLVQSLPIPGPLMTARTAPRFIPKKLQAILRKHMLPLVGIVEDLPDPANRVQLGRNGTARLDYRLSPYDLERGKRLGRLTARILKRAGAIFCIVKRSPSVEHTAHQCGTLRMGTDARHAVLGPDCRLFGHDNLFVVDGSVLPTSLGVGPALTIAANALRVATIAASEP